MRKQLRYDFDNKSIITLEIDGKHLSIKTHYKYEEDDTEEVLLDCDEINDLLSHIYAFQNQLIKNES